MKKLLLIGLSMLFSQYLFAQDFIREEVKPKDGGVTTMVFLEIASQEAAGLLPPQHAWKPKNFKHPKPQIAFPMPDGYVIPKEEEITSAKPQAVQVASPSPTLTFQALTDNNTSIPPDVNGAVGPNHVMTTLNTQVAIRNKTGTLIGSLVNLDNFFVGGYNVFDPKILYDPYNSRWIFTACANAELATSTLLVAVSATNDPTGTWYQFAYDVDATNTYWFDYPSIGFNKDWIAISGNMFPNGAGSYNGTKTYVLKKSDLYANAPTPAAYTFTATPSTAFTLVPAITYDNTLDKIYVLEEWNPSVGTLRMLQITGVPPASPAMAFTNLYPTGSTYSDNSGAANAPQSGSANKISTNDSRVQMVIYRNSSLWVTHSIFLPTASPTRSSVQWWQINPLSVSNTGCVTQVGRIDDATGTNFFAFPSIAVNVNSDVMVGFSRFSGSQFASANYAMRYATDATSTMRDNIVFKAGEASYFKTFSGTDNRWGDYTATTIDPTNDLDFWTLQEYAAPTSGGFDRWATQWAKLCFTPNQPSAFSASTATVCQGQSGVTYTVPAVANSSGYIWTFSGTGATFSSTTNSVSVNYTSTATAGTLSVVANNACGNSVARTLAITVNPLPVQPSAFTASSATVCQGQSGVTYTVPTVAGATSYTWSYLGTGATFASTTNTVSINYTSTATAGTLSVLPNNACGAGVARTLAIIVNPLPVQPSAFTASTATVCQGQSGVTYTVPVVAGATSYTWSYSGTGATFASTTNTVSINYTSTATAGTLSVLANNACGAGVARTLAIIVNPLPVQPSAFTASTATVCQGQSGVTYTVPTVAGATSYTWSYLGTGATFASTTNTVSINYTSTATAGTLSVLANNACGAGTARTLAITVNPLPSAPLAATNKSVICSGLGATLTASGCVGGTITWSNGATGSSINVTPTENTVYSSICTSANCVSVASNVISITVIQQDLAINSVTPAPFEAKDNITTSGTIVIGGNKTYKAGKSILLSSTPSTSISTDTGAVFEAKIEGCSY